MSAVLTIEAAATATGGRLVRAGATSTHHFEGVSIDSRRIKPGQAFVAIRGQRFDGHDFCAEAVAQRAALLVVERVPAADIPAQVPVLLVSDTTTALGTLARAWRLQVDPTVIAITGSLGKTTTKELTEQILTVVGPTHKNRGNLNNQIGLPLTLLDMPADARYVVVELGMSALGEIAYLADLARPNVAAITGIAPVHLEQLGNLAAVARAKAEILSGLAPGGRVVVPWNEPLLAPYLDAIDPADLVRFGTSADCEVSIDSTKARGAAGCHLELGLRGQRLQVELPLVGAHNARNAATAAAIAIALDIPLEAIALGLSVRPQLGHRSNILRVGPWRLLDDCYNASPAAMQAALDTLVQLADGQPTVAVLGRMLELGSRSDELHRDLGRYVATVGISQLITVGPEAAAIARGAREANMNAEQIFEVADTAEAAGHARQHASPGSWMLVKGSRGAQMERAIEHLQRLVTPAQPLSDDR